MTTRITRSTVERAVRDAAAQGRRIRIADAEPGLTLEATPRGGASWRRSYRPRGTTPLGGRLPGRSMVIGDALTMLPDEARRVAREIGAQVAAGRDPAAERRQATAQRVAERMAARTCGELLDDLETDLRTRRNPRRGAHVTEGHVKHQLIMVRRVLDALGAHDLPPAELSAARLRARYRGASGWTARHECSAFARFLGLAKELGHLQDNPMDGIPTPPPGRSRERTLSADELRAVWLAAGSLDPAHRDLVRMLICLPARRGEVAGMRWRDLDGGYWQQGMTKSGQPHRLRLHPRAQAVLDARRAAAKPDARRAAAELEPVGDRLVFPSPRTGGVISGWSRLLQQLHEGSGTEGWTLHDLRRSCVTMLGEADLGLALSDIDAVLNHAQSATRGGVLGVYQRAQRQGAQDRVVEAWARLLDRIIDGTTADVVPLHAGART